MKKKNIVQFLPYYPPHKGGLETHAQQWAQERTKQGYGKIINVFSSIDQENAFKNKKKSELIYDNKGYLIGYKTDNFENLILPAFDIVRGFPFPKFRTGEYKSILKYIKDFEADVVVTRTRFFLTSFIGGLFAKRNKIKWVHIEHGSGYVKLSSYFKTSIAWIYDQLLGKRVYRKSDIVVPISYACKKFAQKFTSKNMQVIYRGIQIPNDLSEQTQELKKMFPGKIIIGYVGRIYKWKNVDSFIKAYYLLNKEDREKSQMVIVGDGEDLDDYKKLDINKEIHFTGGVDFYNSVLLQSQFDIHVHSSLPGGGLASTGLQAMVLGCLIVSTPNEGMNEVIKNMENGILLKDSSIQELKNGIEKALEIYNDKDNFALENQKILEKEFSWDENIKKYYDLFE